MKEIQDGRLLVEMSDAKQVKVKHANAKLLCRWCDLVCACFCAKRKFCVCAKRACEREDTPAVGVRGVTPAINRIKAVDHVAFVLGSFKMQAETRERRPPGVQFFRGDKVVTASAEDTAVMLKVLGPSVRIPLPLLPSVLPSLRVNAC